MTPTRKLFPVPDGRTTIADEADDKERAAEIVRLLEELSDPETGLRRALEVVRLLEERT
jgi:hypothetical protein